MIIQECKSHPFLIPASVNADSLKMCCTFGLFDDFIGEIPF